MISTKWFDINKGDKGKPHIRLRLVGREIANDKIDDLFAATPPLESLKVVTSISASNQKRARPFRILSMDVKRAYFYASATHPVFIEIPIENRRPGDEEYVAQFNLSLYGTRDAAQHWTKTYTQLWTSIGFKTGKGCARDFRQNSRNMSLTCHGDEFTATGAIQHQVRSDITHPWA